MGAQAGDPGARLPRRFGPVCLHSRAADLGAHRSPVLGLRVQTANRLIRVRAHPGFQLWAPRPLIGVRALLGFHVWAPSQLIWVVPTGLQVCAGAAYPTFTLQGLSG